MLWYIVNVCNDRFMLLSGDNVSLLMFLWELERLLRIIVFGEILVFIVLLNNQQTLLTYYFKKYNKFVTANIRVYART